MLVLELIHGWIYRHFLELEKPIPPGPVIGMVSFLHKRLLAAGWCPQEIETLKKASLSNVGCMLLASSSNRKVPQRKHFRHPTKPALRVCEDVNHIGHEPNLMAPTAEDQVHTEGSDSACSSRIVAKQWRLVKESVINIVQQGFSPLTTIQEGPSGGLFIDIQSSGTPASSGISRGFIAIFHNWSDGLGVRRRQKPQPCQLVRIQKIVNDVREHCKLNLPTPCPFWIDYISILTSQSSHPTAEESSLHDRALKKMAGIYHSAAFVVVLDRGIYNVDFRLERTEASWYRIAFSKWMSRGWTFEEAGLAENVCFKFKDVCLTFKILRDKYFEAKTVRPATASLNILAGVQDDDSRQKFFLCQADSIIWPADTQIQHIWKWYQARWYIKDPQDVVGSMRALYPRLARRIMMQPNNEALILVSLLNVTSLLNIRPPQLDKEKL